MFSIFFLCEMSNAVNEQLPPLDAAKLDLAIAYAMNSLFWGMASGLNWYTYIRL